MADDVTVAQMLDFHREFQSFLAAAPNWPSEIGSAVATALEGGGLAWPLAIALMVVVGVAGERLVCWKLNSLNRTIREQRAGEWRVVFGYAVFRVLFELAGVLLFAVFAWIALYFSVDSGTNLARTLEGLLVAIITFRGCAIVSRAILAPASEGIRPIALSNDDARAFHRWAVAFIAAYVFVVFMGETIVAAGMTPVLGRATAAFDGLLLVLILIVFVSSNRGRLARLFVSPRPAGEKPSTLGQIVSQSWVYMVIAWLAALWVNWGFGVFTNDLERVESTSISWWITLLFPAVDRLVNALLDKVASLKILSDTGFEARRERFVSLVQTCVRIILLVVALAALAVTWDIAGMDPLHTEWGQRIISAAVDIGLTVLVAYVLYELVMSMLDKHMPSEPDAKTEVEGEMGGTGATRQETLAPLLRGVFVVLLGIVVVLTVLNSLGVQILPLIAGASIIGLAIGFGSQKLVQDVISGVFFLIDDAFRRGEYIDLGSVKGTVEKISLRSMQLRHHMGALHTIPFGEIRHITNYSRDWVMMKLKLRLTYETDVEKVRKLIKNLGQELLEDENIGPLFLQPLKSQGVYSMEDDSAMILRVKFMTKPGDQFMVRKAVFAKIRELFEKEGIEFAHRVVSVRLDDTDKEDLSEDQKIKVAGAALSARADARSKSKAPAE